jgi:uncharacterized FAD-dependent dehydrogenase
MAYYLAQQLRIPDSAIQNFEPIRVALDSRKKGNPYWSCNVHFSSDLSLNHPQLSAWKESPETIENIPGAGAMDLGDRVVVVGSGPAGMWAALSLVRKGYRVELHEQGKPVTERFLDIRRFLNGREFNPRSNILFGEGGAGAYSDGKLTSRTRNPFVDSVLNDLARAGAGDEVRWLAKAHIGTDRLQAILVKVRSWIEDAGGRVIFDSKLTDLEIVEGRVARVAFNDRWQDCSALVLATGHSARDIYTLLDQRGVALEAKPFAMGVRVEHPQDFINERQFGRGVDYHLTGSAEYSLTAPGAYSFCMCPGGVLIPCASEPDGFATNGMSYSRRNAPFANSGIVVPVAGTPGWWNESAFNPGVKGALAASESPEIWAGIALQRSLERQAFELGGRNYSAPAQTVAAFMDDRTDSALPKSSYPTGIVPTNHWDWMPLPLNKAIAEAFENFERKIPGWIRHGLLVSPETRTSSPLRIPRNDQLESINVRGLYPLGEGAGYAGGITTSAADGVRLGAMAMAKEAKR